MYRCSVDATKTNAFMNNFAEMKRLEFGAKKCHKIQVGSKNDLCFDMRVHDGYGDKVESEKYVGDIISQDGSNTLKVKERYDAGFGTINEIESILDELPLGQFRIITGLRLRESLFISRLLFNSESWYNMKESEIERLSAIDEILMRKILKTPANTCKEALFLETGCLPVKYIIMKRRLMYLQQIVKRPEEELISRFYKAQKLNPVKGDWIKMINEDKEHLKISLSDDQIATMSKEKFRNLVKSATNNEAFKYLMKKKESHSKLNELDYSKLEIQDYLKTDNMLTDDEKCILFKFRVREIEVRVNYKNKYNDLLCQLCRKDSESQHHLLMCEELIKQCEDLANNTVIEYEDIFDNIEVQVPAEKLLKNVWKKITVLMDQN